MIGIEDEHEKRGGGVLVGPEVDGEHLHVTRPSGCLL